MKLRVASTLLLPLLVLPGCLTFVVASRSKDAGQDTQQPLRGWSRVVETKVEELERPKAGFCVLVRCDDGSTQRWDVWAPEHWCLQRTVSDQTVWAHDPDHHGPGLDLPPARWSWDEGVLEIRGHAKDVSVEVPGAWGTEWTTVEGSTSAAVAWGLLLPLTIPVDVVLSPVYLVALVVATANGKLIGF